MMNFIVCNAKIIKQRTRWIGPHLLCTNKEKLRVTNIGPKSCEGKITGRDRASVQIYLTK
jgi:hypothetical protein